ncbi:hypothetical protein THAOC_06022, partial [Thalassiosira oceanica]
RRLEALEFGVGVCPWLEWLRSATKERAGTKLKNCGKSVGVVSQGSSQPLVGPVTARDFNTLSLAVSVEGWKVLSSSDRGVARKVTDRTTRQVGGSSRVVPRGRAVGAGWTDGYCDVAVSGTATSQQHACCRKMAPMSDESRTAEPGSKVGHEGGDEEHQLTDEDKMLDEIAKQRILIDEMPGDDFDDMARRAPHQRKLGQLEFKYQIFAERKRLARELWKFEEIHGALYSEPCLICLEDIHVHAAPSVLMELFFCCGGFICKSCVRNLRESELGLDNCPLCRESLAATSEADDAARLMTLAKRGISWAERDVGRSMIYGRGGFQKQEKAGLEWLKKASAQDFPAALSELSELHRHGMKSVVRKSQEKANELLLKAANLGYAKANSMLASCYLNGADDFEKNADEAYFRASVAFALDNENGQAAFILGGLHYDKHVPEPSLYLGCYFWNIATSEDTTGAASYFYGQALHILANYLNGGQVLQPGANAMTAIFLWLRKSRDLGYKDAMEMLKKFETIGQSYCANCKKGAQAGERFKQCSKCKAQWYCSKKCQVESWRAGHKKDCKRASIMKFEDYLNAK